MDKLIKLLQERTNLPLDYLIVERQKSKEMGSTLKVDCIYFVHLDLVMVSYSTCNQFNQYLINMDKDCCKNCEFYKSRLEVIE